MATPFTLTQPAPAVRRLLEDADVVFWDFDGVIKDSVGVKADAFEKLFLEYGPEVAARVRRHHEANGGLSRYEKMPVYLGWAGELANDERVQEFCNRFSALVYRAVVDAAWVPGVREYLGANCATKSFVLVTATPQEEIEAILAATAIAHCFREVHGSPTAKPAAIRSVLQRWQCRPAQSLVIGDSESDRAAAEANALMFVLRRTPFNYDLQRSYCGPMIDDLIT
jgi:phosphoglycolate phosphatase-like HAD superfamily hydrolase